MHPLIFVMVGPSSYAADPRYFGMNSGTLPYPTVFSQDLDQRLRDLEENSEGKLPQAEMLFHALQAQDRLEIAMLLTYDPKRPHWQWLGYDVGERSNTHWSAIRWMLDFWFAGEEKRWLPELNDHGLFKDAATAAQFLEAYFQSGDSVLSADRAENLAFYGVFPIWMYVPPQNWARDLPLKDRIHYFAKAQNIRIEWQDFPSGYAMVDIWIKDAFVVLQLGPGLLGLSQLTGNESIFDVSPDEHFDNSDEFLRRLRQLVENLCV